MAKRISFDVFDVFAFRRDSNTVLIDSVVKMDIKMNEMYVYVGVFLSELDENDVSMYVTDDGTKLESMDIY